MKLFTVFLSFFVMGSGAMALGPSDSWSEIFANPSAHYYSNEYNHVIGQMGLDNICISYGELRTIRPISVCSVYVNEVINDEGYLRDNYVCKQSKLIQYARTRAYDQQTCVEWKANYTGETATNDCIRTSTTRAILPEIIDVTVWEEHGESSSWPGFNKMFPIPTCVDGGKK